MKSRKSSNSLRGQAIRIIHLVLFTLASIASIVGGLATGLPCAGAAVAALCASRAARSALLRQATTQADGARVAGILGYTHGTGYLTAALLFAVSALRMETRWSAGFAVALLAAGLLNLWIVRRGPTGTAD